VIIAEVVALLKNEPSVDAIVEGRVYSPVLPDAPSYPCLVVWKPTGIGNYTLDGDTGIEDARVQVDCYSDKGQEVAIALKTAVRRFLSGFRGGSQSGNCAIQTCMCINDFDLPDPSTERAGPRLRTRVLEFRIWNKEV
jgi:uncharacterized protein DUF3168